jgi:glutathione S-transferase
MDSGGTLSIIIKGQQCESPPDIYAPRQLSAMEPLFSADSNTRYETIQWVMWEMGGVRPMFGQVGRIAGVHVRRVLLGQERLPELPAGLT